MEARRGGRAGGLGDVVHVEGMLRGRWRLSVPDLPTDQLVDGRTVARLAWTGAVLSVTITVTVTKICND